jgi:hypothetical protein
MNIEEMRCQVDIHEGEVFPHTQTFQDIVEVLGADSILVFEKNDYRNGDMAVCLPHVINPAFREGFSPASTEFDPFSLIRSAIDNHTRFVRITNAEDERIVAGLLKAFLIAQYAGQRAAEAIQQ